MTYDQAVELLRTITKESHIKNQRHIDLAVCTADKRPEFEKALMIVFKF